MYFFRSGCNNFPVQIQLQMVQSSRFHRKVNSYSGFFKLDLKILFIQNPVRNLDSNFSWGLIPAVFHLRGLSIFSFFCQIKYSQLDNGSLLKGQLLGLLYFCQQSCTHIKILQILKIQLSFYFQKSFPSDVPLQPSLSSSNSAFQPEIKSISNIKLIQSLLILQVMDPNSQLDHEDHSYSPKQDIDYSKMSEFRRKRQEYIAEKAARKREERNRKMAQFGPSSSDSDDDDDGGSRSSQSGDIKKVEIKPKVEEKVQVSGKKSEAQLKPAQQLTLPVKKKSETIEKISINIYGKKNNEQVKDMLVIGEKTIVIQNLTQQFKKLSKIKIICEGSLSSPFKIKITFQENQQFLFSVGSSEDKIGLPLHYFAFAKLIQSKLSQSNLKYRDSQQQKIPGVPQSLVTGALIYGKILKKSQVLGNWEERFILINKEGIFSYKKFNQKHSMNIPAGSINQLWTRFELQDTFFVIKIWHGGKKTQFGFPITDYLNTSNWLFGFYTMMGKLK